MLKQSMRLACLVLAALFAGTAHAEEGDYSALQTLWNLAFPPGPDNPVRSSETTGTYGLKRNPAGYADGWQPGAYYRWQTVKLAPSTGAVCGNGSQYKFFVNRVPSTRNTIIYMEGGGACWDYPSCTGASGIRGARNPNGIPDNYLDILANPGTSLVSPFIVRLHPVQRRQDAELEHGLRSVLHGRRVQRRQGCRVQRSERTEPGADLASQRRCATRARSLRGCAIICHARRRCFRPAAARAASAVSTTMRICAATSRRRARS